MSKLAFANLKIKELNKIYINSFLYLNIFSLIGCLIGWAIKENIIDQFEKNIKSIRSMIKGNFKSSINKFKSEMKKHSNLMEFEI